MRNQSTKPRWASVSVRDTSRFTGNSFLTNPYLLGVVLVLLVVLGVARVATRTHHSASDTAARNCSAVGLAAYASGQTQRLDAIVDAAASGNVPEAPVSCSTP